MAKRLVAKTGEYTNQQGETKGEYTRIGVILSNDKGQYVLLDPAVNLAGVLAKQNVMAAKQGQQQRDNVMVSVFDDDNQNSTPRQQQNQQPAYNQQQPNPANYQQNPQQDPPF